MADRPDERVTAAAAKAHAESRRRVAEVFGDVLPETTADELDTSAREPAADEHLRREVPPHHG